MDRITLEFNEQSGLLEAYDANRFEGPRKIWTYSDFEIHYGSAITPSMYDWMTNYLYTTTGAMERHAIDLEDWDPQWDNNALQAYLNAPSIERLDCHNQTTANIEAEMKRAEEKELAAQEALNDMPFDPTSPIFVECSNFLRTLAIQQRARVDRFERELHEEAQWRN